MNILSLLMWVTQFGLSVLLPPCFFMWLAFRLQLRFGLGSWVMIVFGVLGLLVAFTTARANLRAMLKEADAASGKDKPPIGFNDHN